jgi:mono/diheme cytochrome c family protein
MPVKYLFVKSKYLIVISGSAWNMARGLHEPEQHRRMAVMRIDNLKILRAAWMLLPLFLPLAGHAMGMMDGHGMGMMHGSSVRRAYVMRHGIDPEYSVMTNPLAANAEKVRAGKLLYDGNCAACHGETGRGDGPAGRDLDPPPTDLASLGRMPMASDGYLYWAIAEGGTAFSTAMPPFKDSLSKTDIWELVLYLRNL